MVILNSNTYSSSQRTRKRDYALFGLSSLLLIYGCYRMGSRGGFADQELVSEFLIGALIACCGYALSWGNGKCWGGAMLLVALIARMVMLPMDAGSEFLRLAWDSDTLQMGLNPFVDTPIVGRFGAPEEAAWEGLQFSALSSRFAPLMLWICDVLGFRENSVQWSKLVFIFLDVVLSLVLCLRFGAKAASQYAWSPLAILSVAGMANSDIIFLFPLGIGFVIWFQWIEKEGGGSTINSHGGISGRTGQLVCFVAFLFGVVAALNLFMIPIVLWLIYWVLRKAGIKAGLIALLVGLAPLVVSFLWLSVVLDMPASSFIPIAFALKVECLSFGSNLVNWMAGNWLHANSVAFVAIGCFAIYALAINNSIGRMATMYFTALILLMPFMQPWYFLWIAPFAIAMEHRGLKVASVCAFISFLPMRSGQISLNEVELSGYESWVFWAPFLVCAVWFAIKNPARTSGLYIRSF